MRVSTLGRAEEFARVAEVLGPCERVKGEIVRMSPGGFRHSKVTLRAAFLLELHNQSLRLGHVLTGEAGFIVRRGPDTVRGADVAFISYRRLPKDTQVSGFLEQAPELRVAAAAAHTLGGRSKCDSGAHLHRLQASRHHGTGGCGCGRSVGHQRAARSPKFAAGNRKFLTRRLWGVGNQPAHFHHGLLTSLKQAVLAHAGEALEQRRAFERLARNAQDAVIEFLQSLQVLPPGTKDLVVDERYQPKNVASPLGARLALLGRAPKSTFSKPAHM